MKLKCDVSFSLTCIVVAKARQNIDIRSETFMLNGLNKRLMCIDVIICELDSRDNVRFAKICFGRASPARLRPWLGILYR